MPAQRRLLQEALPLGNGQAALRAEVPVLEEEPFRDLVLRAIEGGGRIAALVAGRAPPRGARLTAILALPGEALLALAACVVGERFRSLTPEAPQAHLFEREIFESGLTVPEGHPWLKPVRARADATAFYRTEGDAVHEVAVGPVHAGVIEPGHFRFQAHGEEVLHLEVALGYQHRGVEALMVGGPTAHTALLAETLCGDAAVAHATAYARAVESLALCANSPRARALRGVALELERMANHVGDLGALAGDIGFLPAAAYLGRLRGDLLNATTVLTGSRMGRAFTVPGGVADAPSDAALESVRVAAQRAVEEAAQAADLVWESPSVLARFEGTGVLPREAAEELGIVGLAARASGLPRDVRREFPWGVFLDRAIEARLWPTGDVLARARLRWMEVEQSASWVDGLLLRLGEGEARAPLGPMASDAVAVSLVEGWRGEVLHFAETGLDGRFTAYKVVDPSFHNWQGLAFAMRGGAVSDFPLVNKSFNLSYAGHDL